MGNLSVSHLQETVGLYTFVLNELLVCLTYIGRNDDPNLPLKLSTVYFEVLKALFFVQSGKILLSKSLYLHTNYTWHGLQSCSSTIENPGTMTGIFSLHKNKILYESQRYLLLEMF